MAVRAMATLDMDDHEVAPVVDWQLAQERIRQADQLSPGPAKVREAPSMHAHEE